MIDSLKRRFCWQPDADQFTGPLRSTSPFKLRIDLFRRGVDNAHIDVVLSPRFMQHAKMLVRHSLQKELTGKYPGNLVGAPNNGDLQAVREAYVGMMELAVDRSRKEARPELIQLLQFAAIKYLLQLVSAELGRFRRGLQQTRGSSGDQSNGRAVELHERMVLLAKEEASLRYRITGRLFREIRKLEDMRLSKLRKSVLGRAWMVPRQMLFSPLLQITSLWADEQMMHHYTLACIDQDDPTGFDSINRVIVGLFSDYLPRWTQPLVTGAGSGGNPTAVVRQRRDQGVLAGFLELEVLLGHSLQVEEYQRQLVSWLDVPENMERILFTTRPGILQRLQPEAGYDKTLWPQRRWPEYHHRLLKRIFREFRSRGLDRQVLACAMAPQVYRELGSRLPLRIICQYLAGSLPRQDMLRRLNGQNSLADPGQAMKLLDRRLAAVARTPARRRRWHILRFICDFALLRRDLKLAYRAHWAMNRIRLLSHPQEIELSRENGTLHDFLLRSEMAPVRRRIRGHVILKADLRSSTTITRQLRKRNLNPASHFSLNFFQPINQLLPAWGAKKVFVEGDAVILGILEYEETPYQWLCVARACGLARKILQVIDAQNASNRQHGLPELELGLGIAFSDQAPTFLYDEDREIMISPAINRADQLSSCSALLRQSSFGLQLGRTVEVVASADADAPGGDSGDGLLRYNVNGIELDAPAYQKLRTELALRPLAAEMDPVGDGSRFHVGRYPDLRGKMHWLVLRESPVRVWENEQPGEADWRGRRFYQVITDADLIARLTAGSERSSPHASVAAGYGSDGTPDRSRLH
jgi:hypothetical protein